MNGAELGDVLLRVLPVLIFFVAITVVAEIADAAGVFDVAGHWASRAGRHRTPVLWLLFVLVAVACTVVLSLDTTAVLLTPVGLAIAAQLGGSPSARICGDGDRHPVVETGPIAAHAAAVTANGGSGRRLRQCSSRRRRSCGLSAAT